MEIEGYPIIDDGFQTFAHCPVRWYAASDCVVDRLHHRIHRRTLGCHWRILCVPVVLLLITVGFPLFASPNIMSNGHSGHRLRLQANPRHASFLVNALLFLYIIESPDLTCRYLEMMMAMMVQLRCTLPLLSCSLCTMFWLTVSQCVSSVYSRFCQTAPFEFRSLVH